MGRSYCSLYSICDVFEISRSDLYKRSDLNHLDLFHDQSVLCEERVNNACIVVTHSPNVLLNIARDLPPLASNRTQRASDRINLMDELHNELVT